MEAAALWIAFVSAIGTCGAAIFAGFAMANSAKAQQNSAASAARAAEAQEQALEAWKANASALEHANRLEERLARARLAHTVREIGVKVLSERFIDPDSSGAYTGQSDDMKSLGALLFMVGHPSARKITAWATNFSQSTEAIGWEGTLRALLFLDDRLQEWVEDPDAAMAAIRADPRVPAGGGFPGDNADWRLE